MTVFNTFLKILKNNKAAIILSTVILVVFSAVNMSTQSQSFGFTAEKPRIAIVNHDEKYSITEGLVDYLGQNTEVVELDDNENVLKDAIFYRDISLVVYVPENYHIDFITGKEPTVEYKSAEDYNAALAKMITQKYLSVADGLRRRGLGAEEIVKTAREILSNQVEVEVVSKLDETGISKLKYYFNFESYAILNTLIFMIVLIMTVFNEPGIKNRILIGKMNYKKHNRILLLSNLLFAGVVWLAYLLLGAIMVGGALWTVNGLLFAINSLVFVVFTVSLAFLISSLVHNKNVINPITNVIALGSSFICGAFVPVKYLPEGVVNFSKSLPTYYFIENNEYLATLEEINFESLQPFLINISILVAFSVGFVVVTEIINRRYKK